MIDTHNILNLIGISGIIVAIITGLFNLINSGYNNKLLKYMERNNEINKYRYTKLYETLLSISDMEIITYDINGTKSTKETIGNATNEFEVIRKKYTVVKSILDKQYYSDLDCLFDRENKMSNDMRQYIYEKNHESKSDLKDLLLLRLKIKDKLLEKIQEQIQELTKYTKK
jgi:hypothetical protein